MKIKMKNNTILKIERSLVTPLSRNATRFIR